MTSAKLPLVGAIITTHNCEDFVAEAIASVSAQTVRNLEIVIIDDASTDRTADVIRCELARMGDRRFRFIRLDVNSGQAGAVRRGLAETSATFVCILDGDDVWHENFVERHLAVHLNTDFPVGFTYCDSRFMNASSELLTGTAWWFERPVDDLSHRPIDPGTLPTIDPVTGMASYPPNPSLVLHAEWSPTWSCNSMASMMFRRGLLDLVFPARDEDVRLYLDYYLATFCMLVAGGIAIHEALYAYRMHGKNSHSSGAIVGGTFETSQRDWKSISDRLLHLVLVEMRARREILSAAVGEGHFNRALAKLEAGIPEAGRVLLQEYKQPFHDSVWNALYGVFHRRGTKH